MILDLKKNELTFTMLIKGAKENKATAKPGDT